MASTTSSTIAIKTLSPAFLERFRALKSDHKLRFESCIDDELDESYDDMFAFFLEEFHSRRVFAVPKPPATSPPSTATTAADPKVIEVINLSDEESDDDEVQQVQQPPPPLVQRLKRSFSGDDLTNDDSLQTPAKIPALVDDQQNDQQVIEPPLDESVDSLLSSARKRGIEQTAGDDNSDQVTPKMPKIQQNGSSSTGGKRRLTSNDDLSGGDDASKRTKTSPPPLVRTQSLPDLAPSEGIVPAWAFSKRAINGVSIRNLKCIYEDCSSVFTSKEACEKHMESAHQNLLFLCPLFGCKAAFKDREQLIDHAKIKHCHIKVWECHHCDRDYPSVDVLCGHMVTMHQPGRFECVVKGCKVKSQTRRPIMEHYRIVHQGGRRFVHPSAANQPREFTDHDKYHLISTECPQPNCHLIIYSKKQYEEHLHFAHSIDHPYNVCLECGTTCINSSQLDLHAKFAHPKTSVWKCQCGKSFQFHSHLFTHTLLRHHQGDFACSRGPGDCSYRATNRFDVIRHYERTHKHEPLDSECNNSRQQPFFDSSTAMDWNPWNAPDPWSDGPPDGQFFDGPPMFGGGWGHFDQFGPPPPHADRMGYTPMPRINEDEGFNFQYPPQQYGSHCAEQMPPPPPLPFESQFPPPSPYHNPFNYPEQEPPSPAPQFRPPPPHASPFQGSHFF